jgi:hypothetical protein
MGIDSDQLCLNTAVDLVLYRGRCGRDHNVVSRTPRLGGIEQR